MTINDGRWETETQKRLRLVTRYFNKKELIIILSFIQTVKNTSDLEVSKS